MKKIYTLLLVSFLTASSVLAQNVEFKSANFKDDRDGLRNAQNAIKSGDALLDEGNTAVVEVRFYGNTFKKALNHYLQAQLFNPNNAELNYKIGNCYLYTTEKYKAKKHLDRALELDPSVDPTIYFFLGKAYQLAGEYQQAIKYYKDFEAKNRPRKIQDYERFYKKHIRECETAMVLKTKNIRAWVDNVADLNSEYDDYGPVISTDGEFIIFNSRRDNGKAPNEVGEFDVDVYMSNYVNKKWSKPENLGDEFNTDNDEAAVGLSFDGQKMLLYQFVDGQADIYESFLDGASWTKPAPKFPKNVNTPTANETYACYHPDYIRVYYLSDKDGQTNIYFTGVMDRDRNRWGNAHSAGLRVRSKDNEGSVYIHPDGESMFISSQGFNTMGGYDIFVSKRASSGEWADPVNMGWPINTAYDERSFVPTASGKYAFFASDREGGMGGFDIYKVTFWGPEKPTILDAEDFLLASMLEPIRQHTIQKEVEVEKKSLTVFKGRVIDDITKEPVYAYIDITNNKTGEVITTLNSNSATGKFLMSLPAGINYGIAVRAEGYLFHSENFNLPFGDDFNVVDKEIELKNIAIGSKIALRNIFFETGRANLSSESHTELNRLATLLKDIPRLKVEIGGHTDNVGSEASNQKLSEDRAKAVVNYLTTQGVAADRLSFQGYGQGSPIAPNSTAEGRALNRRTECKIVAN